MGRVATTRKPEFPFLYYGRRPSDTYEGDQLYEVLFSRVPDEGERQELARVLVKAMKKGAAGAGRTSTWSGAHALLAFSEKWAEQGRGPRDFDAFFDHVAKALTALHGVVPIMQIVCETARGASEHPWDLWTRAGQPEPAPGAPHRDFERRSHAWSGKTDRGLATGESNPTFVRATLVAVLGEDAVKAREDKAASIRASGKIAVLSIPRIQAPPRPDVRRSARELLQRERRGQWVFMLSAAKSSRVVAWMPDAEWASVLVLLEEDGQMLRLDPKRKSSRLDALRSDGEAALVFDGQDDGVLLEVALPGGAMKELLRAPVVASGYVGEGRVAVRTTTELVILDLREEPPRRVGSIEARRITGARGIVAVHDGHIVVVDESPPLVVGVDNARVELLSKERIGLAENLYAVDDRVFGSTPNATNADEIVNLDVAVKEFLATA